MSAYALIRPLLFALPPELAHTLVLRLLNVTPCFCFKKPAASAVQAMGLTFPHRIGLAAGFDKDGQYLKGLNKLGFAFIEVGTVTPQPQAGNEKPRLFRLVQDKALINRMGFNNQGLEALVKRLSVYKPPCILGVNIGKNKATPLNQAVDDYLIGLKAVYPVADYITLNISSPNTPDLRQLQAYGYAKALIEQVTTARQALREQYQYHKPLVIKISPDEPIETLKSLAALGVEYGIEGMIVTNTTLKRPKLLSKQYLEEAGGLSGSPLFACSTDVLSRLKAEVGETMTFIASGGIDSPARAQEKLKAGASLLQLYTGLVYQGPRLIQAIL